MAASDKAEAARVVLTSAANVIRELDAESLIGIRAEIDQMVTAYREAGASEQVQGAVAAMAAIKASISASSPKFWPVIEAEAILGLIIAIDALK
jgi:hypothetical protein